MPDQILSLSSYPRAILHIDCDAFFASVEQSLHPELRGKPVITGKERGIVAAASYEAKAMGVKRGVPLWEVKKLCPNAIILPSDYETYSLFSKRLYEIIRRFTPSVEEYSIDEAFADITGFQRPYHCSYKEIGIKIKNTIQDTLGITVSVGLSSSKVLAKVGSKWNKPNGFTAIPGYEIHKFLEKLAVENIWGIGAKTAAYCNALRIFTALEFAQKPEEFIKKQFTKPHYEIWQELNGHSVYDIVTEEKHDYASISKFKTFTPASSNKNYIYAQLIKNLENACVKARRHKLLAKGLIVMLKTQDFKVRGLEVDLTRASSYPNDMTAIVGKVFDRLFNDKEQYRATGVILMKLKSEENIQLSLFEPAVRINQLKSVYEAIDKRADKYGKHAVFTVASLAAHTKTQHLYERGDIPVRKLNRLKGETKRQHLTIPLLLSKMLR